MSRICTGLDEEMAAFRARALGHVEFPYLFADATYLKGRVGGQVVSRAVVVVTGVTATGEREVLGCAVGDTETEAFWAEFFRSLRARGLTGVRLIISDHHEGLKTAIAKCFVGAAWQRCRVHFMLGVSLGPPGAACQVVTVSHRNQPWLYFMLAPASAGCPRYELPGWLRERRVRVLA